MHTHDRGQCIVAGPRRRRWAWRAVLARAVLARAPTTCSGWKRSGRSKAEHLGRCKANTCPSTWQCSSSRWILAVADTRTAPTRATSRSATSTRSSLKRRHAGPLSPSSVPQISRRSLTMRALLRACAHHVPVTGCCARHALSGLLVTAASRRLVPLDVACVTLGARRSLGTGSTTSTGTARGSS